jgi:predicted AAA+ superfamily ATPase
VISELLKRRYNQGLSSNLYVWRNNTGDEVDLVIEQGAQLIPVEIKSSQTFHTDFLVGLQKWTRLAGAAALPPVLVYGGDDNMTRQGVTVQSWAQIHMEN